MSNRMSWYAVAASDDVAGLKNKGFCITDDGEILYNEQYEYALARMYTSDGHGIVDVDTSNFFFDKDASDRITINAEDPMTTPVLSYKLRMTDMYPDAEWFYFAADKSEEILEDGVPHPLYKVDGTLATKTDYADCEFEALNPMPSEEVGMYGRFTTATFSFATYQSTADVLHVEFTGLHQEVDEYCFADRLRVVVTASPAPALPTVSNIDLVTSTTGTPYTIQPNGVFTPYLSGTTNTVHYDSGCSYAVRRWNSRNGGTYYYTPVFGVYNNNPNVEIKNISGNAVTVFLLITAVCSSSQATVVTVYDSSNNPYNAFKFTASGTDYYYVLDGTQTDWTDDLASMGYRPVHKAYARTNKTDAYLFRNTPSNVYDSDGNAIPYIDTNLLGVFKADGTSLGTSGFQLTSNGGLLALNYYGGSGTYAGYAEYTIL